MPLSAEEVSLATILPLREAFVQEMNCQVTKDSIHSRPGWTREYALRVDGVVVGYGSLAIAGPWKGRHAVYEFYVEAAHRCRVFDLFSVLLAVSDAVIIETQSNAPLLTAMLQTFARDVASESILFDDQITTRHPPPAGVVFRHAMADDAARFGSEQAGADFVAESGGVIAATGGILWHYNRPYGDLYMLVDEPFRRRGIGAYFVQEMKRVCREGGNVPSCRCNITNVASRRTIQKAGFVPCGHILVGTVSGGAR